jgi:hypothetical protein
MNITPYLDQSSFRELIKYSSHPDLSKDNVAFTGSPKKHPYDQKKILLISDPFSSNTIIFEFNIADISHAEEISRIVSETGEGLKLIKIWVKKGSLGLKYEPFVVADTINYLKDTEILLQHEADKNE